MGIVHRAAGSAPVQAFLAGAAHDKPHVAVHAQAVARLVNHPAARVRRCLAFGAFRYRLGRNALHRRRHLRQLLIRARLLGGTRLGATAARPRVHLQRRTVDAAHEPRRRPQQLRAACARRKHDARQQLGLGERANVRRAESDVAAPEKRAPSVPFFRAHPSERCASPPRARTRRALQQLSRSASPPSSAPFFWWSAPSHALLSDAACAQPAAAAPRGMRAPR